MALEGLEGLIKGLENQSNWQAQKQFRLVVHHWPKAVGFAVARQTRPVSIQKSTLYVATATPTWAQTLSYERLNILRKLNRYQRQPLKNIRFSTAQWAQPSKPASPTLLAKQHPSYAAPRNPSLPATTSAATPQTPQEAFSRWAAIVQQMQDEQAICSQCQCRCPQGEIDRWSVCSLCAVKDW
ncbi:MAG: DciA family protein [Phormidesmis sp.]